jgi:cobalt transporter subunit CbtA
LARLRHLLVAALLAGVGAGLVLSVIYAFGIAPLIAAAEVLETAAGTAHHGHAASAPARAGYAVLFNCLAGIGFGLLLCAAYHMSGRVSLRAGALWGVGGFVAFFVAPALGLPPSLPGSDLAELGSRQAWWVATVTATTGGLLAIALCRATSRKLLGAALIILPHILGAPPAAPSAVAVPVELSREFVVWTTIGAAAFWLVLGALSGWLVGRWEAQGRA